MVDHFFISQENLSKYICNKYANAQHNLIVEAMKNEVSKYFLDDDLVQIYNNLHKLSLSVMYSDIR